MTFCAAFYKGTRPGPAGLVNRVGRFFSGGPYSHTELVFSDGLSGSSEAGLGVRIKRIGYTSGNWDFLHLPDGVFNERAARRWYYEHIGNPYDAMGCLHFGLGWVHQSERAWFCSESNAAALGSMSPWRYCPNGMYAWVQDMTRGVPCLADPMADFFGRTTP